MTVDKRKVSTDALETLGSILGDGEARDAIHLAVEPVTAGERLYPGQDIGIHEGKAFASLNIKKLGIVDPFLVGGVNAGQKFWLVVYPRQITSLRHVWSHPDFPENPDLTVEKEKSLEWMRNFSEEFGYTAKRMIEAATDYLDHGDYLCDGGTFEGVSTPDEFWTHYEVITGRKPDFEGRYGTSFFTCSC